jgi:hypothetical protein
MEKFGRVVEGHDFPINLAICDVYSCIICGVWVMVSGDWLRLSGSVMICRNSSR